MASGMDGHRSIAIEGSDDTITLLYWAADDTPRLRNLVRREASGIVKWTAELPAGPEQDCFVKLERKGGAIIGTTFTGWEVNVCPETGDTLALSRPCAAA